MSVKETPAGTTGFGSSIPGMKTAPVAHEVRSKSKAIEATAPERLREYNNLSRTIRIINRAQLGPLKDKGYFGVWAGELYPDDVDSDDETTWLQPGEYMDVPKEVAFHLVGNLWDPTLPTKQDIINRYGGVQYVPPANGAVSGRNASMVARGMPTLPDLIVAEVNARGKVTSEYRSMYELYTKGLNLSDELFAEAV